MTSDPGFPPSGHDHRHCVADVLAKAEHRCADRGARLTALRRLVLEIVWASHRPIGAYDILARLAAESGRAAAPPTVYRALDFLLEQDLIHRVASLNAFVGCPAPGHDRSFGILICEDCGCAAELSSPGLTRAIADLAHAQDFTVRRHSVELVGRCHDCRHRDG